MKFEYDTNKSKTNEIKHNINFESAKELWKDPYVFELPSKSQNLDENINYTAIITYRKKVIIRIISVRRSSEKEMKLYESIRTR